MTPEETKALSDQMQKGIEALNTAQTRDKEIGDKILGQDEVILKASNAVADAMQRIQDIESKSKAESDEQKAKILLLEKKIARGAIGSEDGHGFAEGKAYLNQLNRYLKKQIPIDRDLIEAMAQEMSVKTIVCDEPEKFNSYKKDMVEGSNPTGGYWVLPERSTFVIKRDFETSPLRLVSNIISTSSNQVDMIIDDNESGSATATEVQTQTATTTPEIGLLSIPVNEIYANQKATQWMLEDAGFDLASWLNMKGMEKIARQQNTAFVVGTGANSAVGLLSIPDNAVNTTQTYVRGQMYTRTTAGSLAISADDLKLMQSDIKEVYQPNAVWMMKRRTFGTLTTLKDTVGQYVFQTFFLGDRASMQLLGKRIIFADDLGGATTANAYPVVYGDFGQGYTIVDRLGNRFLRDPYSAHPFTLFRIGNRYGGAPTSYDSLVRMKVKA